MLDKFNKVNKLWSYGLYVICILISLIITVNIQPKSSADDNIMFGLIDNTILELSQQETSIFVNETEVNVLVEYNPVGTYKDTIQYSIDTGINQATSCAYSTDGDYVWLNKSYADEDIMTQEGSLFYELTEGILTITFSIENTDDIDNAYMCVQSSIGVYGDVCCNYLKEQKVLK